MSNYLLQLIGKWFSLLIVSSASFLQTDLYNEIVVNLKNNNTLKSSEIVAEVVEHETVTTSTNSLPVNTENVVVEGSDGLIYTDKEQNTEIVVSEPVTEEKEIGTGPVADYVGKLTGYGADCYGCSGDGYLACNTKNGGRHSLKYDGIYYNDEEYGSVRILAAATAKFPCGTIVEVNNGLEIFTTVVLDTGGDMITAWKQSGQVWMDLAFATQEDARNNMVTTTGVKYTVKRWGW